MVVVLRDAAAPVRSARNAEVDACLVGADAFRAMMAAHKFRALACALGPEAAVLKSTDGYRGSFRVDPAALRVSVGEEVTRDWERIEKVRAACVSVCVLPLEPPMPAALLYCVCVRVCARQCFEKGDVMKGRQIVGHMLRMVVLAGQLAQHGRIVSVEDGNDRYEEPG
jgi:hypothetical protein